MANVFREPLTAPVVQKKTTRVDGSNNLLLTTLRGGDQFFGPAGYGPHYDLPNPIRRTRQDFDPCIQSLLTTTLAAARPGTQSDWPNPTTRKPQSHTVQSLNLLETTLAVPCKLTEWPNPLTPPFPSNLRGFTNSAEVHLLGQDDFFRGAGVGPVYDWPNPTVRKPQVFDWGVPNALQDSLAQPYSQRDWPNPRGKIFPSELRGFVGPTNVELLSQDQFFGAAGESQARDFPNPVRRVPQVADYTDTGLLLTTLAPAPTVPNDWPNPSRHRSPALAEQVPSLLVGPLAVPGRLSEWPNPNHRATQPVTEQTPSLLVGTLARPFSRNEWPNPIRRTTALADQCTPSLLENTLAPSAPNVQTEWPNPTTRSRQIHDATGANLLATTLATVAAPFAMLAWPNPTTSTPTTATLYAQNWLLGSGLHYPSVIVHGIARGVIIDGRGGCIIQGLSSKQIIQGPQRGVIVGGPSAPTNGG